MERDANPPFKIKDEISLQKIELSIKLLNNITVPAIILENNSEEDKSFNLNELKQFYGRFGEVFNITIKGKQNIVLFKTFFSANICKMFLENKEHYYENNKNTFSVRWFDIIRDSYLIPNELKEVFENISKTNYNNNINNEINIGVKMDMNLNYENLNMIRHNNQMNTLVQNNILTPFNNLNNYDRNILQYNNSINSINNINGIQTPNNMFFNNKINNINESINLNAFNNINNNGVMNNFNSNSYNSLNNMNHMNHMNNLNNINIINNMNNISNINNFNINMNDNNNNNSRIFKRNNHYKNIRNINNMTEDKIQGKYTCKYEILIENDSEFQIARKLIGSKGINMKKIINECKIEGEIETVKLRLRGKGSGYKEGPQNKESDEPLHLCISSRTKEELNKASFLVNKLLDKINEEYKLFCKKFGRKPKCDKIARKIENKNMNFKFNN